MSAHCGTIWMPQGHAAIASFGVCFAELWIEHDMGQNWISPRSFHYAVSAAAHHFNSN